MKAEVELVRIPGLNFQKSIEFNTDNVTTYTVFDATIDSFTCYDNFGIPLIVATGSIVNVADNIIKALTGLDMGSNTVQEKLNLIYSKGFTEGDYDEYQA